MPDAPTPWFGLAALIAMFAIPFLPKWLFEGPRKVRHWPQRHVCAECGVPWTAGHLCAEEVLVEPVPVAAAEVGVEVEPALEPPHAPLRGELRRVRSGRQLERRPEAWLSR
jgi:hypothetical protein